MDDRLMAKASKTEAKIDTPTARKKLSARRSPYWRKIQPGRFIGYRTSTVAGQPGNWIAKFVHSRADQPQQPLGKLEDIEDEARFSEALKAAQAFFAQCEAGSTATGPTAVTARQVTLQQALKDYALAELEKKKPGNPDYGQQCMQRVQKRFEFIVNPFPVAAEKADKMLYKPLVRITGHEWAEWLKWMKAKPVEQRGKVGQERTVSSVNRDLTMVRAALNRAADKYDITTKTWDKPLRRLKDDNEHFLRMSYLTREQRAALAVGLEACGDANAGALVPMCRVMDIVPLRPGAAAALTIAQYEKREHRLHIWNDKAGQGRRLAMPRSGPVADLLAEAMRDKLPTAFLFTDARGKHWSASRWQKAFNLGAKEAGLPEEATIYWLRHSCITDLVNAGHPSNKIARMAGTSVAMIEKYYFHMTDDDQREMLGEVPKAKKARAA
jgi:Phage integrase family